MSHCHICMEDEKKFHPYTLHICCSLKICFSCSIQLSNLCPICDRKKLHQYVFTCCICKIKLNSLIRVYDLDSWETYCKICYKNKNKK